MEKHQFFLLTSLQVNKSLQNLNQIIISSTIMDISPVNCPKVPADFHLKIRQRFIKQLHKEAANDADLKNSISLFKGIETLYKNYDDIEFLPEQESTFWYLFGVKEPDCFAIIHNGSGKVVLFVPLLSEDYKLWMFVKSCEEFKKEYNIEEVRFTSEIKEYLKNQKPSSIYLFSGLDSDSGLKPSQPSQDILQGFSINREVLWPLISNMRVTKSPEELQLIRYVCKITSEAIVTAARSAKPGLLQNQLHTVFQFQHSIKTGSLQLGFNSICSSGQDCATLHYIENNKIIEPNQMVLLDMGGRWYGYIADQSMTFPVSGKFDEKQKAIYTAVLEAQKAVKSQIKPGVKWDDMHLLAEKVILEHLIKIGIVNEFPMEELQEKRVGAIFFPHGLGHFFGLKTHDVGGYIQGPPRSDKEGLSKLRTRRVLEEGVCITVEPGCYFIDFKLEKSLNDPVLSKYLNRAKVEEYWVVGGVRLQDDVVITKDGYEDLTHLPRQIDEVEKMLAAK